LDHKLVRAEAKSGRLTGCGWYRHSEVALE